MEAMKLTADGAPMLGTVVVGVLFVAALWHAVSSAATIRALTEPLGVLVVGAGPLWLPGLVPWNLVAGVPLIAIGGYASKGYRWISPVRTTGHPRRPRRSDRHTPTS